ncbi:hypothetical protein COCCADRAFT_31006 [Bipolaris zeicola 26-R-13]|uniref:Uncharacterized protein n=1 Tax=Cochliobolus carbonum (strain 26-R-13) TaxID=930089 RepID=W6XK03_COCC2|nr:uncharacterized protein COCCADRAFT_31006 [Bipolaris zeicola 26-R-13]EUC27532.1 hypothetical protein COCCADRAFT_31006 [Bipolaris zeicola 26-R-13]
MPVRALVGQYRTMDAPTLKREFANKLKQITSSLIILALLFKNVMPLALNSVRTTSHVSVLRNATPLFIGASRLHRTTLFQQSLRVFPRFIQKAVSKAMTPVVAPKAVPTVFVSKLIDAETRQRHRIKRMAAQRIYQQNARRLAAKIYNAGPFLYYGHTGSNYYDYDPGKSNRGFDSFSDVVHGRIPLGEAGQEEEDEGENEEIRKLEEENDESRGEVGRLRKENSELKGQSEEEFEDEEFDRLVNG